MTPYERLRAMNLNLPDMPQPAASYVTVVRHENVLYVSGQTPRVGQEMRIQGKLGAELSLEQGQEAARLCALRCLAAIHGVASLEQVRILKVTGFVNSTPDFTQQSQVVNGASEFLVEVLGQNGRHARSAVGVASLPGHAAVEIELVALIDA